MSLLDLLRAPALRSPRSLSDQLEIIRQLWKPLLGDSLERFLLMAGEILREEELAIWAQFNPPGTQARAATVAVVREPLGGADLRRSARTNTKNSRPTRPGCPARC